MESTQSWQLYLIIQAYCTPVPLVVSLSITTEFIILFIKNSDSSQNHIQRSAKAKCVLQDLPGDLRRPDDGPVSYCDPACLSCHVNAPTNHPVPLNFRQQQLLVHFLSQCDSCCASQSLDLLPSSALVSMLTYPPEAADQWNSSWSYTSAYW